MRDCTERAGNLAGGGVYICIVFVGAVDVMIDS